MNVYHDLQHTHIDTPTYLSVGNFDGVHRGHQVLLRQLATAAHAAGGLAGIVTFDPHPREVLRPDQALPPLNTLDERLALLQSSGLDVVIVQPFTMQIAQMEADEFVHLLVDRAHLRELWVGPDFALGRQRAGTVAVLQALGAEMGFTVQVLDAQRVSGEEVRSGRIRQLLLAGDVATASQLLGRPHFIRGEVVGGDRRGSTIGFPTANLAVIGNRLVPANGVYAAWVDLPAERRAAVTNIGVRPTFAGQDRSIEAHILDFSGDLYGQVVTLHFVARLRGEQRFTSVDDLVVQIRRDVAAGRAVLQDPLAQRGIPGVFEELEHTADWAVRIAGATLPELYAHAGQTLFHLMGAPFDAPATVTHEVTVEANDLEVLLVRWLQELLFRMETADELYTQFTVAEVVPPAGGMPARLRATVAGVPGRSDLAHVKAVTYHNLAVQQTDGGWEATVVFDT
jgi:riboflavin kinase/FMN adenylyltransferase